MPADLGHKNNCKKVVEEVVSAFGRIDIVVNNNTAEHTHPPIWQEIGKELLDRVFRTNSPPTSSPPCLKHALKHMPEGRCIINTIIIRETITPSYVFLASNSDSLYINGGRCSTRTE